MELTQVSRQLCLDFRGIKGVPDDICYTQIYMSVFLRKGFVASIGFSKDVYTPPYPKVKNHNLSSFLTFQNIDYIGFTILVVSLIRYTS